MGYTYNKVRERGEPTPLAQIHFTDFCATESAAQWYGARRMYQALS